VWGQDLDPFAQAGLGAADGIVASDHEVAVDGRTLAYTARAGRIPIRHNATGEARGMMFFVAYTVDGAPDAPRPLTFVWNGGPGSSSSLVHLLGFGPKRLTPDGTAVANDDTWLDFTDLVFVDPIGTGYSRPTRAEYAADFYQDRGDAESVAELIRVYLTRADAHDAPLFLAGESFGVLRATRVADVLRRRGIPVAGVVHIGLVPPLARVPEAVAEALAVPSYAAAALFHGVRSGPFEATVREAAEWARDAYAPGLAAPDRAGPAERADLKSELARRIGIDASSIDSTLVVGMGTFAETLLRDRGLVLGRYDTRLTGPLPEPGATYDPRLDPSLSDIIDDVGVIRYLRGELGFRSDLSYQGPFGGGYPSPASFRGDWMSVLWDRSEGARAEIDDPTSDAAPAVEKLLRADPELRLFVACGYFDLVCPYAVIDWAVEAMDPELSSRITVRTYRGGHAVYTDEDARRQVRSDVRTFMRARIASGR